MPKDSGGHGSNPRGGPQAHAAGVSKIGQPVKLRPEVVKQILSTAKGQGFTAPLNGKEAPNRGYQAAIPGHKFEQPTGGMDEASLQKWAGEHSDALRTAKHIGGYNNEVTGNFEIEPSQKIMNRNSAVRIGTARNQVSIWDNRKGREIKTGGNGR